MPHLQGSGRPRSLLGLTTPQDSGAMGSGRGSAPPGPSLGPKSSRFKAPRRSGRFVSPVRKMQVRWCTASMYIWHPPKHLVVSAILQLLARGWRSSSVGQSVA